MSLVSILVPVYNVEKYFRHCLESLFEQDFNSIEYLFVNDCSTDCSMDILNDMIEKYPNRKNNIKIVNHSQNMGLAAARNTAVQNATSDYIIHVDSDDYIDRNMVSKMYAAAQAGHFDIVLSDILIEYANNKSMIKADKVITKYSYLCNLVTRKSFACIFGKLIKRDLIINNNIYAKAGINNGEDYQVYPRIAYFANSIGSVNAVYHYNKCNANSYTNSLSHKGIEEIIISQGIINDFFSKDDRLSPIVIEESNIFTEISLLSVASIKEFPYIASCFKDYKSIKQYNIKLGYKILLLLIRRRMFRLSYIIISLYKILFWRKRR